MYKKVPHKIHYIKSLFLKKIYNTHVKSLQNQKKYMQITATSCRRVSSEDFSFSQKSALKSFPVVNSAAS